MPSSPFHASAAATPKRRLMQEARMEEPSFRTRLRRGRDALISISCLSSRNSRGQAYGEGEDGEASFRTRLCHGRDALISISCLSGCNSPGQAYGGSEVGEAQLPDSSVLRP
ncbi:hypothetical protein MRX96_045872 [Rhipicephalus microplus]